ncbi:SGNH/GDSL hydrolase family protein [Nocardia sp. CA-128927]|uniref:SGNH/GDSL hydrolase family protein n=1 Tax=Nocardia sp. CA-128927 TaxID=3239975 RepID=UPI003D997670
MGDESLPLVRIAVLGDSTAAGHGVDTNDAALAGCLARELAARTSKSVAWEAVGQLGATASRIRYKLLPKLSENLNVAVLLAGGNDVLARRTPAQWADDLTAIVDDLTNRAEHVAVSAQAPFADFPALPTTLGRYLAERADTFDKITQQILAERPRTTWISRSLIQPVGSDFFARDGFHPSATGYRRWAEAVAGALIV